MTYEVRDEAVLVKTSSNERARIERGEEGQLTFNILPPAKPHEDIRVATVYVPEDQHPYSAEQANELIAQLCRIIGALHRDLLDKEDVRKRIINQINTITKMNVPGHLKGNELTMRFATAWTELEFAANEL